MNGKRTLKSPVIEVDNPFTGGIVDTVSCASVADVEVAVRSASEGNKINRSMARHERAVILARCADRVAARSDDFAMLIVRECGKTITQAKKEVSRCENTLRLSAEEAKRNTGELIPFDAFEGAADHHGYFVREPLGIIVGITPFNDPLNLVAHKLGPAIAGGNAIILKPSRLAPLSAFALADALIEAGLPSSIVSVLACEPDVGIRMVADTNVRMVSFTGGVTAGEEIARAAGLKKLTMDLGGNAPVIVLGDCNLQDAAEACVSGAFWAAGQNCIGVQRILVHRDVYPEFADALVARTKSLNVGDPLESSTDVGPMITEAQAKRIAGWVDDTVSRGARVLTGHIRDGALYHPTVLENVSSDAPVLCQEAFAPVVVLQRVKDLDEAIEEANRPAFSLHAAIFTRDIDRAFYAADRLEAGGIMINDSTDFRFDGMPFGGFKRGGLGREGVRFALEEMTQTKVVCFRKRQCSSVAV